MPWFEGEGGRRPGIRCLVSAKGNHVASQEMPPEAGASSTCPVCGTEMVITRITPILFGGEYEDLTLACKKCGSAKELRIKRI
jgi:transcription elongation factor Elf1